MWELTLTCDPDNLDTLKDCQCPTAAALLEAGDIKCAKNPHKKNACPEDCEVCKTCMVIIGCEDIYELKTVSLSGAAKFGLGAVMISSASVAAALAMKAFKERKDREKMGLRNGNLPAHLMAISGGDTAIELSCAHRAHREASANQRQQDHGVWLAPLS